MTEDALVWVGQLGIFGVYEGLQLGGLTDLVHLNEGLPGVVCAAGAGQQIVVNIGVLGGILLCAGWTGAAGAEDVVGEGETGSVGAQS